MMTLLAVMVPLGGATTVSAATTVAGTMSGGPSRCYNARTRTYYLCKKPNFYRRHRKAVNIGAGAVAGAVVGGLIGGKRGAGIGALGGAGGGYLVTKKQRPKNYVRTYRP